MHRCGQKIKACTRTVYSIFSGSFFCLPQCWSLLTATPRAPDHVLVPDHWTKPSAKHLQSFLPWASHRSKGRQGSPRCTCKIFETDGPRMIVIWMYLNDFLKDNAVRDVQNTIRNTCRAVTFTKPSQTYISQMPLPCTSTCRFRIASYHRCSRIPPGLRRPCSCIGLARLLSWWAAIAGS